MPRIISPDTPESNLTDHSEHNAKIFGSPKDRLDFYRREIQYETTILANRTDAYLTAQSFLVIAFVSCMGNLNPEWGKLFTMDAQTIRERYPHWDEFRALREASDPTGRFANAYTRRLGL